MYARAFIILGWWLWCPKSKRTQSLRCGFVNNELGGPPIGDIEVSALVGNTNNTDANGKFTFSFPNRDPVTRCVLIVRKERYVVVNDIQLELTLPTILRRGR